MISFPNAKINLGLNILGKREDGYHEIQSCFYPIPWYDSLEIIKADSFGFHSYGLDIPGNTAANLCVKAYELLKADHEIHPVEIHLLKAIPMGAGLGGGSADGAFTLKMLNKLFELNLTVEKLQEYALQLGSDCPFFIENKPVIATGRGEQFESTDLDLSDKYLAIHNPGIHISTQEAYAEVSLTHPNISIKDLLAQHIQDWQSKLKNDFEKSVFPNHPKIEQLKKEMIDAGASYASMTGSGSTVFGVFDEKPKSKDWKILKLAVI